MDAKKVKRILVDLGESTPNAALARRHGVDRRTVRRYRRRLESIGLPAASFATLPADIAADMVNVRGPRCTQPDFAALEAEFPNTPARVRYAHYRERVAAVGGRAMSRSQFNRCRSDYETDECLAACGVPWSAWWGRKP